MTIIATTRKMDKRYEYLPCYQVTAKGLSFHCHSHSRAAVIVELQARNLVPSKHYHFDGNDIVINRKKVGTIQKVEKGIIKRHGKIRVKINTNVCV